MPPNRHTTEVEREQFVREKIEQAGKQSSEIQQKENKRHRPKGGKNT